MVARNPTISTGLGKALPRLAMPQAGEGAGEQRRSGEREKDSGQEAAGGEHEDSG